jgi:hypothetical protein
MFRSVANNSSTAIPLKDLPSVLSLFSQISELRLRTGPALDALWTRPSQERQLRKAVAHLRGTLRAVQVSVCRSLRSDVVVKQTYELFPPSRLSFLSIATHDQDRGATYGAIPPMNGVNSIYPEANAYTGRSTRIHAIPRSRPPIRYTQLRLGFTLLPFPAILTTF